MLVGVASLPPEHRHLHHKKAKLRIKHMRHSVPLVFPSNFKEIFQENEQNMAFYWHLLFSLRILMTPCA
jgi:hypothetical protein